MFVSRNLCRSPTLCSATGSCQKGISFHRLNQWKVKFMSFRHFFAFRPFLRNPYACTSIYRLTQASYCLVSGSQRYPWLYRGWASVYTLRIHFCSRSRLVSNTSCSTGHPYEQICSFVCCPCYLSPLPLYIQFSLFSSFFLVIVFDIFFVVEKFWGDKSFTCFLFGGVARVIICFCFPCAIQC